MKREALIRALTEYASKNGQRFTVKKNRGKGSHYLGYLGTKKTTLQSGELDPLDIKRICGQLGIDPNKL